MSTARVLFSLVSMTKELLFYEIATGRLLMTSKYQGVCLSLHWQGVKKNCPLRFFCKTYPPSSQEGKKSLNGRGLKFYRGIRKNRIPELILRSFLFFLHSDFGGDSEQQLLIIQSIIQNGTFNYKEYVKLLKEYSEHGLQGVHKNPLGFNNKTMAAQPDFHTNPVSDCSKHLSSS